MELVVSVVLFGAGAVRMLPYESGAVFAVAFAFAEIELNASAINAGGNASGSVGAVEQTIMPVSD